MDDDVIDVHVAGVVREYAFGPKPGEGALDPLYDREKIDAVHAIVRECVEFQRMRAEDLGCELRGLLELGELRRIGRAVALRRPAGRALREDEHTSLQPSSERRAIVPPQPSTSSSGCAAITSARFMTGPLPTR